MDQKEKRNAEIIKLHNSGLSTQQIADKVGLSKAGVYKVINSHLEAVKSQTVAAPQAKAEPTKPKETASTVTGKRITNFGEYSRTGVNQYAHKSTGEIITVKFVPATDPDQCGHFITV
jgi:transposase